MLRLGFGAFNGKQRRVDVGGLAFSLVRDDPDMFIRRHVHEAAHVQILLDGEYITEADPGNEHCGPMTTLWIPAGTTHRDRFRTRGGSFMTVSYSEKFFAQDDLYAMPGLAQRITSCDALASALIREFRRLDEMSSLALEGIALHMLALTSREQRTQRDAGSVIARQAYAIVQERFLEKLSLQSIAKDLGATPRGISAVLQRYYGRSLCEILRERRVRNAAEHLSKSELGLADIAAISGFADQAQFTKAFKQILGVTPAVYRSRF